MPRYFVIVFATAAVLTAAACESNSETENPEPDEFNPPQEEGTTRYRTGMLSIPPAGEKIFCTVLEETDEEMFVSAVKGYQHTGGHHTSFLYATLNKREPGVHECTEDDMISTRHVATGNTVYDSDDPFGHEGTRFPQGFVVRIPPGAQLIIQSHYLNYTDQPQQFQDVVDVKTIPASEVTTELGNFSAGTANFSIPARSTAGADAECEFSLETNFMSLSGHTHKLGTLFTITHVRDGQETEIYRETNGVLLEQDAPNITSFPDGSPLKMLPDDQLLIHCEWANSHDYDVGFPEEMCGLQAHYYPSRGDILCAGEVSVFNCGGVACTEGEVCCVSSIGQGHCSTAEACETSYTCSQDSECSAENLCCEVPVVGQVCLSDQTCPGRTPCPPAGQECEQLSEFLPMSCCEATGFCDIEANCMM